MRGPGTPGEEKTVAYLTDRFRSIGLRPGNPDGGYVQDVPLVETYAAIMVPLRVRRTQLLGAV